MDCEPPEQTARARIRELAHLDELARSAQEAHADEDPRRRKRIDEFHAWASWWHERYGQVLREWEQLQHEQKEQRR